MGGRRILFSPKHLVGMAGDGALKGPRALEVAFFSGGANYKDDAGCPAWPPQPYADRAAIWVRAGNLGTNFPTGPIGIRQADTATKSMFPRANFGTDNIPGFTTIECISQKPILGKEVRVTVKRSGRVTVSRFQTNWGHRFVGQYTVEDMRTPSAWECSDTLPPGDYWRWYVGVRIDGRTYAFQVMHPAEEAEFLRPWEACSFFTEFWNKPQAIAVEVWDAEVIAIGGLWKPIRRWIYSIPGPGAWEDNAGYGPRVLPSGRLELSNDQPADAYAAKGSILTVTA